MNVYRSELIRISRRWPWIAGAFIIMVGFQLMGILGVPNGTALSGYLAFLAAVGTSPSAYGIGILPLIATIVSADSIAWDRKEGVIRFYLTRTRRKSYLLGKLLAILTTTASVFSAGLLATFIVCMVIFPARLPAWHLVGHIPTITAESAPGTIYSYPMWFHALFFYHPLLYCGLVGIVIVLSALTWASVAVLISHWTHNIYVVLAGPWLLYIAVSFGLIAGGVSQFNPMEFSGQWMAGFSANGLWPFAYWLIGLIGVIAIILGHYVREGVDILD